MDHGFASTRAVRRIAVCGALGANLGDQALSYCLCGLVSRMRPDAEVVRAGLDGRAHGPEWSGASSSCACSLSFDGLRRVVSGAIRPMRTALNLSRWYLRRARHQRRMLATLLPKGESALVIGGGQLLMDTNLAFPLSVRGLTEYAAQHEVPTAIVSCGVQPDWSARGVRLFRGALTARSVRHVSTRDPQSLEHLTRLVPALALPMAVTPDPALWLADLLPAAHLGMEGGKRQQPIALVPLDPRSLVHPTESGTLDDAGELRFWCSVAENLAREYHVPIHLVTTGKPADHRFAERIARYVRAESPGTPVSVSSAPKQVDQLAAALASCSLVIAYRLHALIIATSYSVPWIALEWDRKVTDFASLTKRPDYCLSPASKSAVAVTELAGSALRSPVEPEVLESLKSATWAGVAAALTACGA